MLLKENEEYRLVQADCITHMAEMPDASVSLAVFSPPFPAVYAYSELVSDLGNSEDLKHDGKLHFSYFFRQLARVVQPGRVIALHCTDIVRYKRSGADGGVFDFPGMLARLGERAGLIYEYRWVQRCNPQAQAIRTRSRELQFAGMEADRANCRGALPAYILKFRTRGENKTPVDTTGQVSRNDWIKWAETCWDDINETDTLNVAEARGEKDTRHVCPLQLELLRRLILLYTNPGEIVFDPFSGIGSTGFMALGGTSPKSKKYVADPRRYYGIEQKDEYFAASKLNLARAIRQRAERQRTMFDIIDDQPETDATTDADSESAPASVAVEDDQ